MVKKFNLSVPDELAEKIDQRRDYLGSLSAIFQKAVADKIRKKDEFEQRLEGDEKWTRSLNDCGKRNQSWKGTTGKRVGKRGFDGPSFLVQGIGVCAEV